MRKKKTEASELKKEDHKYDKLFSLQIKQNKCISFAT